MSVPRKSMRLPMPAALLLLAVALLLAACRAPEKPDSATLVPLPEYGGFGEPQRVNIRGYDGDAMEPYLSRDGRYLLFNNRNDPRIDTKLLFAERVDDLTFEYRGELDGVNSSVLDAVPSMDRQGILYFISTRSYDETLSTLYRGRFDHGTVSAVELAQGVSLLRRGMLIFDAEVSADGNFLFVVDGRFSGGQLPDSADIDIAVRDGTGFRRLSTANELLKNLNTDDLEFAPAIADDLLEIFFTRLYRAGRGYRAVILRAVRPSVDAAFAPPERVASITGFVEAPTLSSDARSLYYHLLEGGRYVILRVTR